VSLEQTLVFLVFFAIAFLQFLARMVRRAPDGEPGTEQPHSWQADEHDQEAPTPLPEPVGWPPVVPPRFGDPFVPEAPPVVPRAPLPLGVAPGRPVPAVVPRPRWAAPRPPEPGQGQPRRERDELFGRAVVPRSPAELRRAIVLMTLLGPPRSLAPYDS
jgi:hypothetical protein